MELRDLLKRIDDNKKEIDKRKPLTTEEVKQLDAYFRIGTTYTSNALEAARLGVGMKKEAFSRFIAECEIEAQKDYCRMFQINLQKKTTGIDSPTSNSR